MNNERVKELVLQSLAHELGGIAVYETAIDCAVSTELKSEWQKYLEETRGHVTALEIICQTMGIDPKQMTPGRSVVERLGAAMVEAMKLALAAGDLPATELVACECVVLAETKVDLDWELIGKCAEHLGGAAAEAWKSAYDMVEDEEDEHLSRTKG